MRKNYRLRMRTEHEQIIIRHLEAEWISAEKAAKRHEIVQLAKRAGLEAGRVLLGLALVAGALTIAAVAPNTFAAFGRGHGRRRYFSSEHLPDQIRHGSRQQYWRYKKTGADTFRITLTPRGEKAAFRTALHKFKLHPGSIWDGKWRVVMFDISKKHSSMRDALRRKLLSIGMYPLQESVFLYPYPCKDEVLMWVELFGVRDGVEIIDAYFDPDRSAELMKIFNISPNRVRRA